ncbi:hypothetical protein OHC33_005993 [Knufia fluminis]|uniref:Ankyrin repeat protein n=1 Tax=Knufia fluminis TaxID=191047 RepID=A0AAN8EKH7_9EURO|nr:hypothetical protein OHC33_005993 [Knufia fluminis]
MRLFEINMQIPLSDLKLFIEDRITDSEDLTTVIEQNNIKVDRIASRIQDKTPLSFLAAEICLNSIEQATNSAEFDTALDADLSDLSKLYDESLKRLRAQSRSRAQLGLLALSWLSLVKAPLTLPQLAHAICVSSNGKTFQLTQVAPSETIFSACVGLVTLHPVSQEIRLLHSTVLERFKETKSNVLTNKAVLEACIYYLGHQQIYAAMGTIHAPCPGEPEALQPYPFLGYALSYWYYHVDKEGQVSLPLLDFLGSHKNFEAWANTVIFRKSGNASRRTLLSMSVDHPDFEGLMRGELSEVVYWSQRSTSPYRLYGMCFALRKGWNATLCALLARSSGMGQQDLTHLLYVAIRFANVDGCRTLLEHGASPTQAINCTRICHDRGAPPSHFAFFHRRRSILKLLIQHGASVNEQNSRGYNILHKLLADITGYGPQQPILDDIVHLLDLGAGANELDIASETPLHVAMRRVRTVEIISVLLERGASTEARNYCGQTPLHVALTSSRPDSIVALLLKHKSPVSTRDNHGHLPIHEAVRRRRSCTVLKLLLQAGAEIDGQDTMGDTGLHLICRSIKSQKDFELLELLLAHGANVNARNHDGNTALHLIMDAAARNLDLGFETLVKEHVKAATVLLKQGADLHIQNVLRRTPLQPDRNERALTLTMSVLADYAHEAGIVLSLNVQDEEKTEASANEVQSGLSE